MDTQLNQNQSNFMKEEHEFLLSEEELNSLENENKDFVIAEEDQELKSNDILYGKAGVFSTDYEKDLKHMRKRKARNKRRAEMYKKKKEESKICFLCGDEIDTSSTDSWRHSSDDFTTTTFTRLCQIIIQVLVLFFNFNN